jgi:hypothetical protein
VNTTTLCHSVLVTLALLAPACKRQPSEGTAPPPPPAARAEPAAALDGAGTPGTPPPASTIDPPAPASEFREAAQYLPQGEIDGWHQSGAVVRSTTANLSQIIDGAAVSYEQYGVRNFARTDYRRPGSRLVTTVEVYEFAEPLGAFGRYTMMLANGRDPASLQSQGVQVGGGGYQGTTQLAFWKGRHLVQISVADESDEPDERALAAAARDALPRVAAAVQRLIPADGAVPPSPLPQEGIVWGGNTYVADGVFGIEQTGPAWVGYYRAAGGQRYRLALFARDSATEAQRVFARLRGAGASAVPRLGDEAFAVPNEANGEIVVARRGNAVYAIADGGAPGLPALDRNGKIAVLRTVLATPVPP